MKIAVVGLGKMGHQILEKLHTAGHDVIGVVRRDEVVARTAAKGMKATTDIVEVISFFGTETPIIWLMIPADNVDSELNNWMETLPAGSIIVDGGNSKYADTQRRFTLLSDRSIQYVDIGTSGGVHGLSNGFSMMIGGGKTAYERLVPALEVLATPRGAFQYFGPSGSGHYVKMVHNAIEYGMMESLAEGYRMLEEGAYKGQLDLAAAGEVWQHSSVITSWLNELARDALKESPTLEGVDGFVAESGETRWTLENAKELGLKLPSIEASFDVRLKSQQGETHFGTKLLAAMRNKFGGHSINEEVKGE
jgi:6-phosphogluconate dehydrogenase